MVTTSQPIWAEVSQFSAFLPTGVDVGAGLTKLVFGSGSQQIKVRTPSKVLSIREKLHDELSSKEGGHFYYHGGDREDLVGCEFLTGNLADWAAPTTHTKLSDDPALKVQYGLHLLLGALSTLPYRPEWNLYLVLSVHNAKLFKQDLLDKTSGTHFVSFKGKEKPQSKVNLKVSLVVPEGAGSYSYCVSAKPEPLIDRTAHALALDLGTSTVIPIAFAPGGGLIRHLPLETGGVIDLLHAIATDSEVVSFLGHGKSGNIEVVRQGIESGSFQYGTRPFNFKAIYARHLSHWLATRLRLGFKELAEWRDSAQSFVAWGGGAELPGVAKLLASQGVTAVGEGCWANAIGLQRLSEGRLAREVK